jgi:hypothetical protein
VGVFVFWNLYKVQTMPTPALADAVTAPCSKFLPGMENAAKLYQEKPRTIKLDVTKSLD